MDKIIQITEDVAVYVDDLQFIKKVKKGNSENPYYDRRYYATLEDCLEDIHQDLIKKKLIQDEEADLKKAIGVIENAKEEIKEKIESSNRV